MIAIGIEKEPGITNIKETMQRVTEADKIVEQLQNTDNMCQVAEIIDRLDIDTMK